jgi:hypothetical protein
VAHGITGRLADGGSRGEGYASAQYLYASTRDLAFSSSSSVAKTFRGLVVVKKCFARPSNVL